MKEAVELAWVGSLQKTAEPHARRRITTKLGEASFKAPTFATSDGVRVGVGFMQREAATMGEIRPSSNQWPGLPRAAQPFPAVAAIAFDPARLAPSRQQPLEVGEVDHISAIPDVMKEPATAPIARCPSALEKLLEVEWRAWLDSGTLPVGQIVQRDWRSPATAGSRGLPAHRLTDVISRSMFSRKFCIRWKRSATC
jgi:hypothetical protein